MIPSENLVSFTVSKNGKYILAGDEDSKIYYVEANSGKILHKWDSHGDI